MLRKLRVWNAGSLLILCSVTLQHSDLYRSTGRIQVLYSLILVLTVYWEKFYKVVMLLQTFLTLLSLLSISFSAPPSKLKMLPRYLNLSVIQRSCLSRCTGAVDGTLMIMASVFYGWSWVQTAGLWKTVCLFYPASDDVCGKLWLDHLQNRDHLMWKNKFIWFL